jgi:hypothetical protein
MLHTIFFLLDLRQALPLRADAEPDRIADIVEATN